MAAAQAVLRIKAAACLAVLVNGSSSFDQGWQIDWVSAYRHPLDPFAAGAAKIALQRRPLRQLPSAHRVAFNKHPGPWQIDATGL
jgi:hypothetical protein